MKIDRKKFFDGFRKRIDSTISQEQVEGLEFLLKSFENDPQWKDPRHVAYALATVYHETAGSMQPVEEGYYLGSPSRVKAFQKTLRYYPYFGRGFVQLTWETKKIPNYSKASKALGVDFVKSPHLVMVPKNAFNIMTRGMFEGWFTGKKLSNYINGTTTDYRNARKIINGLDKAGLIAGYAQNFEKILKDSVVAPASMSMSVAPASIEGEEVISASSDSETGTDPQNVPPPSVSETETVKETTTPEGETVEKSVEHKIETTSKDEVFVEKEPDPPGFFQGIKLKIAAWWVAIGGTSQLRQYSDDAQSFGIGSTVMKYAVFAVIAIALSWFFGYSIWFAWKHYLAPRWLTNSLVKANSTPTNVVHAVEADQIAALEAAGYVVARRR